MNISRCAVTKALVRPFVIVQIEVIAQASEQGGHIGIFLLYDAHDLTMRDFKWALFNKDVMPAEAFQEFMDSTIDANPNLDPLLQAERLMVIGLPVTRILEVVDHLDPIMVVMGSQGRTGLKHLVIGSKAAQIVQLCPVPVTIVKKPGS